MNIMPLFTLVGAILGSGLAYFRTRNVVPNLLAV
jgi:hypothetical protein